MIELQRWRGKRGLKFHLQPARWPFGLPVYVLDSQVLFWGQVSFWGQVFFWG